MQYKNFKNKLKIIIIILFILKNGDIKSKFRDIDLKSFKWHLFKLTTIVIINYY